MDWALKYDFAKNMLFKKVQGKVMKMTQGNYPAPLKIIEAVRTGLDKGSAAGYIQESKGFAELGMTPESGALVGLYHGQTGCKKNRFGTPQKPVK